LAILFSHFRIIFNLHSVEVFLFIYPGHFFDFFNDYAPRRKALSSYLSRNYFLEDRDFSKESSLNGHFGYLFDSYFNGIKKSKFDERFSENRFPKFWS
jgi:hypothetical protein